jgi:hypothetical protein
MCKSLILPLFVLFGGKRDLDGTFVELSQNGDGRMNFNSNGTSYPCKSKVEGEVIGVSIITNQRKKKKAKMLMDIVFVLISFSVCVFVCALSHAKRKKNLNYLYNKYVYSCVFLVVGLFMS